MVEGYFVDEYIYTYIVRCENVPGAARVRGCRHLILGRRSSFWSGRRQADFFCLFSTIFGIYRKPSLLFSKKYFDTGKSVNFISKTLKIAHFVQIHLQIAYFEQSPPQNPYCTLLSAPKASKTILRGIGPANFGREWSCILSNTIPACTLIYIFVVTRGLVGELGRGVV